MAKIKVHELAKELGVKSSVIIDILKNKGIEVKNHMSVLEDGQVEDVKKAVKAPAKSEEAPKTETAATEAKEHVKKKKSIIFVSNPSNSKMPGGAQIPRKAPRTDNKKQTAENANKAKETAKQTENVKPAKEAVAKEVVKQEKEKPEVKTETKPEATQALKSETTQNQTAPKSENRAENKNENKNESKNDNKNGNDNVKRENRDNNKNAQQRRGNNDGQQRRGNNDGQRRDRDGQSNNSGRNNDGQQRRGNNDGQRRDRDRDGQGFNGNRNNDGQQRRGNNDGQRRDRDRDRDGQNFGGNKGFDKGYDKGFEGARKDRNKNSNKNNSAFVPESPMKDAEKHRDEEKRRISQEKDKRNRKDLMYDEEEEGTKGGKGKSGNKSGNKSNNNKSGNKAGKFIKPEKKPVEVVEEQIKTITIPETLTIKDLADKMKLQPSAIVKKLFMQGQIVTVNQEIDYETAENIAIDYDVICEKEVKVDVIEELLKEDEENTEDMVPRPPVICVMGHVDHGKTSLLDAIRKTNVTDKEAGGITQHIGAYTVNINGQKITFLDTPGHEAFTAMRMRGANSTDIAILVVAADDGVMPQTVEAINHAKAAGIEIIVAVNKIDKPGANIERVKQELTEYGLIAEDWGGSTVFVPVSAKNGEGIENLLEMILLTAEVLELKANPNRRARGLVIEAELDKGRGPVATVLVQKGTLKVGDFVSAGAASGKVRAMIDDKGKRVKEAGPSTPVEILGLGDVPNAGEIFIAHENDKEAKYYAETFVAQNKEKLLEETKSKMSLDDLFSQIKAGNLKELNLIIKADVQGSVEAVKQSLMKLSNDEVVVKCIHGGVGAINESDVILASASNAIIIGFNVRPDAQAKATAEREGVDVRLYKVIYQAIEDIEAAMKGMLDPIFEEKVIGHAEVRQIFKASAVGNIAGSYVLDGVFQRDCKIRITREGNQIYEGKLASLKRFKDDVKEVKAGFECGLVFDGFDSMQELDIVEAYIMVEVPR
jgi:translation initiation factor IF-2